MLDSAELAPEFGAPLNSQDSFVVDLGEFEGPLDLLLELARKQKVDIAKISILSLAEQYLAFVEKIRSQNLDMAAEYLVMAAWLAYLKSQLLLPKEEVEEEDIDAQTQAAILAWRLKRLAAVRDVSKKLMDRQRLGIDVLAHGQPQGIKLIRSPVWKDTLYDLVRAYAFQKSQKQAHKAYQVVRSPVMTVEVAYKLLSKRLGITTSWEVLENWLPLVSMASRRSVMASTFAALLIMAKDGLVELKQKTPFAPIYLRDRKDGETLQQKNTHAA